VKSQQRHFTWLIIHLVLGLAWVSVLSALAHQESAITLAPWQVAQMLIYAGWLPTIATSCWQAKHRNWKALLLSDHLEFWGRNRRRLHHLYSTLSLIMLFGFYPLLCYRVDAPQNY